MKYSNSYIQQFKSCPLACYLKYEVRLEKIEEGASEHHLIYGKAFHEALSLLYLGDSLESAILRFKKVYPVQLDPEDKAKTIENGEEALKQYAKRWMDEDAKNWKIISVELKESFDFGQEEHFTVVLDMIAENKNHGGIYGFDHKVVGGKRATLSYDYWNEFNPNSQITKYFAYIKSKFGDCSGFYINAIGMRNLLRAYKGETAGFHPRFERQMFSRSNDQLEQEKKDTEYWIGRIEQARLSNYYGMNTESCKFCTYRAGICGVGYQWPLDEELILNLYQIKAPRVSDNKGDINAVSTGIQVEEP